MNPPADTSLPAIGRRLRKPANTTIPSSRTQEFDLSLSKVKLLLLELFSPDYYTVTDIQIRLSPGCALPVTVTVETDSLAVVISPKEIVFRTEDQEASVMVFATDEPAPPGTITLIHRASDHSETFSLAAYFVTKTAFKIYSCGLDEHYQLATELTAKRFVEEMEEGARKVGSCRPVPEVLYDNDNVLFHQTHEGMTFCSVDPPAWMSIAAGDSHALATTSDGSVYSWGSGEFGQLGISVAKSQELANALSAKQGGKPRLQSGSPYVSHQSYTELRECCAPVPVKVTDLARVVQVACGAAHSLALTRDGVVYAFGRGNCGQLGLGNNENASVPTAVPNISEFRVVKVGRM